MDDPAPGPQSAPTGTSAAPELLTRPSDAWLAKVSVTDRHGMETEHPTAASFDDINGALPQGLADMLDALRAKERATAPTPLQQVAMPLLLERRDVSIVAPTGTGKTLAYLVPALAHVLQASDPQSPLLHAGGPTDEEKLAKRIAQSHKDAPHTCVYCGLDMDKARICPETGAVHPPVFEDSLATADDRKQRVEKLTGVTSPRIVIIAPTTQLAQQIHSVARQLHCGLKVGLVVRGVTADERTQVLKSLEHCDVLVSVPGALLAELNRSRALSLREVDTFVLDEADKLLSLDHYDVVKQIMSRLNNPAIRKRGSASVAPRPQIVTVAATMPTALDATVAAILNKTRRIVKAAVSSPGAAAVNSNIAHNIMMVSALERFDRLLWLYDTKHLNPDQRTIIFCNSAATVRWLAEHLPHPLRRHSLRITHVTQRLNPEQRAAAMRMFTSGGSTLLIATDSCARGIDFRDVMAVINFDMPQDMDTYHHRIGRCGRRGLPGVSYTMFQPEDARLAADLCRVLRRRGQRVPPRLTEYARLSPAEFFKKAVQPQFSKRFDRNAAHVRKPALGRGDAKFPGQRHQSLMQAERPES